MCLSLLMACSLPQALSEQDATQNPFLLTATPASSTDTPQPSATPDPWANARLVVVGEEEVVFDWSQQRCENESIPDLAARAFRDAQGLVHVLISTPKLYYLSGSHLGEVARDCTLIRTTPKEADPALWMDNEWISSLYTEDGQTIYALVHNEYQGHTHAGQCPQNDYFLCWYNTVTMLVSRDGGQTFEYIAEPPAHYVAGLPYRYEAGAGTYGLRGPSNIIEGPDGYYYVFLNYIAYQTQEQYVCLMRTDTLDDPASWRYWDGEGFGGRFLDPYLNAIDAPEASLCQPLAVDQIGAGLNESITYNTELERYVLIGISADHIEGREVWGFYYSFSGDLLHWTHRELIMEVPLPWTVEFPGSDLSYLYPSLLDPDSLSLIFNTTDAQAYLYYTRNNFGHASLDRDLIRVPVEFQP